MPSAAGFTQLQAAQAQLETALALYLDGSDYLSAITLAGAADNLTGQMMKKGTRSLAGNAKVFAWLVAKLGGAALDEKAATTELNDARDWLKHYKPGSTLHFDPKARAQEMLERAVYNTLALTGTESERMRRFHAECTT
jgi:hypothetical protein